MIQQIVRKNNIKLSSFPMIRTKRLSCPSYFEIYDTSVVPPRNPKKLINRRMNHSNLVTESYDVKTSETLIVNSQQEMGFFSLSENSLNL